MLSTCLRISHVPFTFITPTHKYTLPHTHPTLTATQMPPLSISQATRSPSMLHMGHRHRSKTMHGSRSLNKLSSSSDNLSQGSVTLSMQGKSRSNLSLGRSPSMTSVIEEPLQSISTSSEPNIVI